MTSLKIRNFYFERFIEKIKKTKFFISKIFYNSPIYGKLNLEELTHYTDVVLPNLWEDDIEKIKNFLKRKFSQHKCDVSNEVFFIFNYDTSLYISRCNRKTSIQKIFI